MNKQIKKEIVSYFQLHFTDSYPCIVSIDEEDVDVITNKICEIIKEKKDVQKIG